jgi:hypothetical protein
MPMSICFSVRVKERTRDPLFVFLKISKTIFSKFERRSKHTKTIPLFLEMRHQCPVNTREETARRVVSMIDLLAGAIAWSRTLLTKIEKAMDIFKVNRHIVALGNFPMLSKLYNRTAKALLVYEQLLLTRWKEKIEAWKEHLNANLLCLVKKEVNEVNLTNAQLAINSNIELFSIFDEVKWFQRLDVDIPKAASLCMQKVFILILLPLLMQRCSIFFSGTNIQTLQIVVRRSSHTFPRSSISNLSAVLSSLQPSSRSSLSSVRTGSSHVDVVEFEHRWIHC